MLEILKKRKLGQDNKYSNDMLVYKMLKDIEWGVSDVGTACSYIHRHTQDMK